MCLISKFCRRVWDEARGEVVLVQTGAVTWHIKRSIESFLYVYRKSLFLLSSSMGKIEKGRTLSQIAKEIL